MVILAVAGCKNQYQGIPNVNVDVCIYIQDPSYQNLAGIGSWAYVEGGSKGIVVYNLDNETYLAYERHCPYEPENTCSQVSIDDSNFFLEDTCCTSKYQLVDGSVVSGPASLPLKAYRTSFDGNIIRIWN